MAVDADSDTHLTESDPQFVAPPSLELTLVRDDDAPDRCTLSPRDVDEGELLTRWLSVDAALALPVSSMR